jgi:hypothetical protein
MTDAVAHLDAIAHELRRADKRSAAHSRDAVAALFRDILNLVSEDVVVEQVQGAQVLCLLYLIDLEERPRPSGLNIALASVRRLRADITAP